MALKRPASFPGAADPPARHAADTAGDAAPPRFDSRQLFGAAREIVIEHNARAYRLRVTAQGKLILTA